MFQAEQIIKSFAILSIRGLHFFKTLDVSIRPDLDRSNLHICESVFSSVFGTMPGNDFRVCLERLLN